MEAPKIYPPNFFPNIEDGEQLSNLPDTREELIKSLTTIVKGSPPHKPWTDSFKPVPQGLWTGPSSIAYMFFSLSKTHPGGSILYAERRILSYLEARSGTNFSLRGIQRPNLVLGQV